MASWEEQASNGPSNGHRNRGDASSAQVPPRTPNCLGPRLPDVSIWPRQNNFPNPVPKPKRGPSTPALQHSI